MRQQPQPQKVLLTLSTTQKVTRPALANITPAPAAACENENSIDYIYKVGQKVLLRKEGILCNAESRYQKKPWLIASVHTNGTIMAQRRNKIDRMNIQRTKPFEEELDNE